MYMHVLYIYTVHVVENVVVSQETDYKDICVLSIIKLHVLAVVVFCNTSFKIGQNITSHF